MTTIRPVRREGQAPKRPVAKRFVARSVEPAQANAVRKTGKAKARPAARSVPLDQLVERATNNTLAANPLVGVRARDVLAAATSLLGRLARQPRMVSGEYARLVAELARIAIGRSAVAATPGDRRFADPAWTGSAAFRRLVQGYVALASTLDRCVERAELDATNTERARFVVSLLVDALAPSNYLPTNPAALRKLVDTRGASVIRGFANLVEDLASGRGLPKQVDPRGFRLGKNLATSAGAVVYRNELLELIQYAPTTPQVHERPLLIVPPQINKYYVFDLAPGKSIVRWALDSGLQTFVVSWRNPTRDQGDWGFDAYVEALGQAVDAVREITGSADANVWGACSGAIVLTLLLAYLAAGREAKVHAATLAVCMLDTAQARNTTAGRFVTPATIKAAKAASQKQRVLEGKELARMFAWMRPNDLVWNYVVNNYLLGNEPPAHDILYWNNDTTRLPARLHADFLGLFESNPLPQAGKLSVRGRKIDVGRIGIDTYVVGGLADHITPWQGVYRAAQLYGGRRSTFVLANGGHIQSLINPPGNARSWFMTGAARATTPQAWLKRRDKAEGSWWGHWRDWARAHSGPLKPAPAAPGSERHPAGVAAPGNYVLEP